MRAPQDGQKYRSREKVAIDVVKVEFLDQVNAPSAGQMLHFREKRLYHIADAIVPVGRELYRTHSLVPATPEFQESPAEGNASEVPPGIAHGGDPNSSFGTDYGNRVTGLWLEIVRSVPADDLVVLEARVKDGNSTLFQAQLGFYALKATENAAAH